MTIAAMPFMPTTYLSMASAPESRLVFPIDKPWLPTLSVSVETMHVFYSRPIKVIIMMKAPIPLDYLEVH